MTIIRRGACVLAGTAAVLQPITAHAQEQGPREPTTVRVSTGLNFSEGRYGRTAKTRILSAPVTVRVARGGFTLRVSVPFVSIDGPGTLLDGARSSTSGSTAGSSSSAVGGDDSGSDDSGSDDSGGSDSGDSDGSSIDDDDNSGSGGDDDDDETDDDSGSGNDDGSDDDEEEEEGMVAGTPPPPPSGVPVPGNDRRSGLGDITITAGYALPLLRELTLQSSARIKVPTASRTRAIGTGRTDATLAAELIGRFGRASIHAGARHRFLGKPAGWKLRNGWGFGTGASYRLPGGVSFGADYDWLQSATPGRAPISEATAWVSVPLSRTLRLQGYAGTGFSSRSADLLAGMSISLRM